MEDRTINIGTNLGSPVVSGNVQGNVSSELRDAFNTYHQEQKQNLTEAAAEIQQLLEQLEKSYSTETTIGKMGLATEVIERIDNNPTLRARVLNALKAGSVKAFEQFLNHPAASFVIAALEDWHKNKKS